MSSSPPSHGSLSSRVLHLYDYRWLILGHMHDDGNVNYVMYVIPQAAADRPQQENAPSCARRRPGWAGRDRQLRRQLPVRRRDVVLRDVPFVSSRFSLASRSPFARRSVLPAATSREMVNDPELMDLSLEVALLVVCGRAVDVQSVQLLLFGLIELLQVPRLEQPRQHPLAERDEQRDGNRKEDPRESRPRETCRFVDGIFRQSVGKWRWWHGRPGLALDRDSPSTGTRSRPGLALDRTLVDRSHATIRGRTRTARTTEEMNRRKQTSRTTKQHRTVYPTDDGHLEDREPGNDAERHRLEERNMRLFVHLVPPPRVSEQQQRPLPQLAAGKRLKRHERKVAPQQAGGNPPYGRGQP